MKPALETGIFTERFRALNLGALSTLVSTTTQQLSPPYLDARRLVPRLLEDAVEGRLPRIGVPRCRDASSDNQVQVESTVCTLRFKG